MVQVEPCLSVEVEPYDLIVKAHTSQQKETQNDPIRYVRPGRVKPRLKYRNSSNLFNVKFLAAGSLWKFVCCTSSCLLLCHEYGIPIILYNVALWSNKGVRTISY